jgi:hypothetical protein
MRPRILRTLKFTHQCNCFQDDKHANELGVKRKHLREHGALQAEHKPAGCQCKISGSPITKGSIPSAVPTPRTKSSTNSGKLKWVPRRQGREKSKYTHGVNVPRDLRVSQKELLSYLLTEQEAKPEPPQKMEKLPTLQCEREKAAATADDSHSANRLLKSSTSITSSKWSWPGVRLSSNTTPEDPTVRQQEDSR